MSKPNVKTLKVNNGEYMMDFVDSFELHQLLGTSKRYNDWVSKYVLDNPLCSKNIDYKSFQFKPETGRPQTRYRISVDIARQLCVISKSENAEELASHYKDHLNILRNHGAYANIKKDLTLVTFTLRTIGMNGIIAKRKAVDILEKRGIDVKRHFPEIIAKIKAAVPVLTISKMAKILFLKPIDIKQILCDMGLLLNAYNNVFMPCPRLRLYVTYYCEAEDINSFIFDPKTLVMIEVKHYFEAARFWDVTGKKPAEFQDPSVGVTRSWCDYSTSLSYLKTLGIEFPTWGTRGEGVTTTPAGTLGDAIKLNN